MRHIALIAINFFREQRWPILVLMSWVFLLSVLGLVVDLRKASDDVLFIFKQGVGYGILFTIFFGASAIHNERKTRRILAVLSKSVGRGQYISGLITGIMFAAAIYSFAMGVTGTWVLGASGFPAEHLWLLMLCVMLVCLLCASLSVLFSTFLNPLFATMATGIVLGLPAVAALQFRSRWAEVVPAYSLIEPLMKASSGSNEPVRGPLLMLALGEAVFFWVCAFWIFERRDIAVAVD
ncbi:MAG TPA: ABC transporter permease [Terriglobales bacterium]|nr:ABC transporter permease [Terriglobales bacterium]